MFLFEKRFLRKECKEHSIVCITALVIIDKIVLEFSDLVALREKLPTTSFVPLFTSNWYMNSNRDLRVYRVGTHLLMTNPLENNIL